MMRLLADTIENVACEWVIRMDEQLTTQEHTQLTTWLNANPRHRVAFLRIQKSWTQARGLATLLGDGVELAGTAAGSEPDAPVVVRNDLASIDLQNVRLVACRITRNFTVAHDIAQNVFARLYRLPPQVLQGISCLEEYAAQVAMGEARDWQRQHARYIVCNKDEVLHTLAQLPERESAPFMLCRMFSYSAEEAAAQLGISVAEVCKRIDKALNTVETPRFQPPPPRKSRILSLFHRKEQ